MDHVPGKWGSHGSMSSVGVGQSGGRPGLGSGKTVAPGSGLESNWRGGGSGAAATVAAGASGESAQGSTHGCVYRSRGSNGSSSSAASGMMGRLSGLSGGAGSSRGAGGGPSALRVSGGAGTVKVSSSAGRASRGACDSGSTRSGRYTRLARYGPGVGSGNGSASLQYKAPQSRAYNLRSTAAQFSASSMGLGGLGGSVANGGGGGGGGLGAGDAGTVALTPQRTGLGGAAGAKPPYGVVPGASGGVVQSYPGRQGSNTTVGVSGSLGGTGNSGGVFGGGGGVGFGRHKYG